MPYRYFVMCWVRPSSGYDVARKNRVLKLLKEMVGLNSFKDVAQSLIPGDVEVTEEKLHKAIERFEDQHDGLVLEPLILESDKRVEDPEKDLLPEIQKKYPEAKLYSCKPMSHHVAD